MMRIAKAGAKKAASSPPRKRLASNEKTPLAQGDESQTEASRQARPEPRLPHESDQSSDSQVVANEHSAEVMRQAAEDIERGLVDTDRSSAIEPLKREHFSHPPARTKRR